MSVDKKDNGRLIEILLVEDNPADVRLTQEALKDGKLLNSLSVVGDGVEALAFLRRQGQYKDAPRPDLILLDLNLPKKDGREVLAEIKTDEKLKSIPVVVLTVSKAEEDILKTYKLHANCYVTKPVDLDQFMKVTQSIEDFWFSVVKLPPKGEIDAPRIR
ncbi:MAG TPA: response regulator [Patescibacteria group bacterium]|nr:response regulator [Patescibacteria group bacterium]